MAENEVRQAERVHLDRNPAELSPRVHQRLNSYALAASAAGVAVLACSVPADCAPVCKNVFVKLLGTDSYSLNPGRQLVAPFNLVETNKDVSSLSMTAWNRGFLTPNSAGAKALLSKGFPAALASGATIGPGGQFGKGKSYGMLFTYGPANSGTYRHHLGNLPLGQFIYVGFQFSSSGENHYGWARLKVTFQRGGDGPSGTMQIPKYGYETTPNTAIRAGQCSSEAAGNTHPASKERARSTSTRNHGSAASPAKAASHTAQPATVGALALGAQGLALWR
jgi:hypothetical protein